MKHRLIIAALLVFGYTSPVAAGTVPCVTTQRCPEGVKPPACCQPPPCEFFEQIKMKQATRRLYRRTAVKKRLIRQAGGDNREAALLLDAWVKDKSKNLGGQLRCKWEAPYGYAGGFETKPWCEIFASLPGGEESMSEKQAHEKINTCAEFIDAIYAHENHHKEICGKTNSTVRQNEGLTVFAKEESEGYRREIASLKASLQQFWNACSTVEDAATARQVAAAGISVLKNKAPTKNRKQAQNTPAAPALGS
jgi:hypothetical protein